MEHTSMQEHSGSPDKGSASADIANSESRSSINISGNASKEPSADLEASQLNKLEKDEITLVVEVSADTEMTHDGFKKDEVIVRHLTKSAPALHGHVLDGDADSNAGLPITSSAALSVVEILRGADSKFAKQLDISKSSSDNMHGLITKETETSRQITGDLGELKMKAELGLKSCNKMAADECCNKESEEDFSKDTLQLNALIEGPVDAEKKKDFVDAGITVQSNLAVMTTFQTVEQSSISMVARTQGMSNSIDVEAEGVQGGPIKGAVVQYSNQEEAEQVNRNALMAVTGKDVTVTQGMPHLGARLMLNDRIGKVAGQGLKEVKRGLSTQIDCGIGEKIVDKDTSQSDWEMESDDALGMKGDVMQSHQSKVIENDQMGVSASSIKVCAGKESVRKIKAGQENLVKPPLFGEDIQMSAVVPGPGLLARFENGEADCRDSLRKKNKNHSAQAEMLVIRTEASRNVSQVMFEGNSMELSSERSREGEACTGFGSDQRVGMMMKVQSKMDTSFDDHGRHNDSFAKDIVEEQQEWRISGAGYETTEHLIRICGFEEEKMGVSDEANTGTSEEERYYGGQSERGFSIENARQKRKLSENPVTGSCAINESGQNETLVKKAKKKAVNVWAKTTSRKGPKKTSRNGGSQNLSTEDSVILTPVYVNPDKVEDGPDQPIALSKFDKAEKIELSEDRLTASSTKGYRMVRATRGVQEGSWFYEIIIEQLGPTGHTRLGWSTQKGDVQAPVGFDSNSYGYRDLDGSKTHVAVREPYGDLYVEGDVIGFYVHLPNGSEYAPKPVSLISHRGRGPYLPDVKEEQPRRVPGSEICFFRNGVCQGTAFENVYGGRYFPAASMYTLPKEPNCTVRFNFGPDFRYPPLDLDGRPAPTAMVHAPYHNALNGLEVGPVTHTNACITDSSTQIIQPHIKTA